MGYIENNQKLRELVGNRTDFYCLVTHQELKKRNVRAMGMGKYLDGVEISTFKPEWHQLMYVIKGEVHIHYNHLSLTAKQGKFILMPAGLERRIVSKSIETGWMWIHLNDVPEYNKLKEFGVKIKNSPDTDDVLKLFRLLRQEPENSVLITPFVDIISEKLIRLLHIKPLRPYESKFNKLWQEVRENPQRVWSIDQICKEIDISKSYLNKLCSEYFKSSPIEIVTKIRLEYGAYLLKSSNKSIEEIAFLTCFSSSRSFSRSFSKKYLITPGMFRKDNI